MKKIFFPKRFALTISFGLTYLAFAFIVRLALYSQSFSNLDFSMLHLLQIMGIGFLFDVGSLSYIGSMAALYLLMMPARFHGCKLDRILTNFAYGLFVFVMTFSFLAEITFWDEYQRRFNFIAIDYLLYTWEVVQNIHQSFPLPFLISLLSIITFGIIRYTRKKAFFTEAFDNRDGLRVKIVPALLCFLILAIFHFKIQNSQAEVFENVNENELAKSGIYSFFAAFQAQELNFDEFYQTRPQNEVFADLPKLICADNDSLFSDANGLRRWVSNQGLEAYPNIIFIGMESMNADYMAAFGNTDQLTPSIDSIFNQSVAFTSMYATGTRTIRGLEAFTLSVPPTPGRSIVKRPNNNQLFTISNVFKQKGYACTFICGGDGHFDHMATYFGNNGFDVMDRQKPFRIAETFAGKHTQIPDSLVTFENTWGACDGDILNVALHQADKDYQSEKPFFYFFMTNSNHQPYTYPDGVIDIPSGGNKYGGAKYADESLGRFFEQAKNKPWFNNTVFVVASDHCTLSAGKWEINVKLHHIPAFIYNLQGQKPQKVNKLCSQIDLFPTLFGYLNWSYASNLFGQDIRRMTPETERAFVGNHRKVGLLKRDKLLILEVPKTHSYYKWDVATNELTGLPTDSAHLRDAITYYQSAFNLFKNGGLKANLK